MRSDSRNAATLEELQAIVSDTLQAPEIITSNAPVSATLSISYYLRKGEPALLSASVSSWPQDEIPIGHVTNGVHIPTWDSAPADDLWTESCGKDRWLGAKETLEQDIRRVSDASLWQFRTAASKSLVEYARERLSLDLAAGGAPPEEVEAAKHLFDPNALTLGLPAKSWIPADPSSLTATPAGNWPVTRTLSDIDRVDT